MILRSPFYNFHIFSFSLGFISGFNNHLINIHLKISRKIPKLDQLYLEYIIIFIIKILGYFWGVTRVYAISPEAEYADQPDMQGTFLLLHLLTRVAFELNASYSFMNESYVIDLGLEVEAFREAMCECSPLGCKVRVDRIGWDCELEISKILFMVDPRDWGVTVWHHCVHVHGDIASS